MSNMGNMCIPTYYVHAYMHRCMHAYYMMYDLLSEDW